MREWFRNNFQSLISLFQLIFALIGIALTLYFSIFYVPEYLKKQTSEKIKRVNENLIYTTQELIYGRSNISKNFINSLIKGAELENGIDYPYTADELLIQTRYAFLNNKFIPLSERAALACFADSIRHALSLVNSQDTMIQYDTIFSMHNGIQKIEDNTFYSITTILIAVIGLLTSIIGVLGITRTISKRGRDLDIDNNEYIENLKNRFKDQIEIFNVIRRVSLDHNFDLQIPPQDYSDKCDVELISNNIKYLVTIKTRKYSNKKYFRSSGVKNLSELAVSTNSNVIAIGYKLYPSSLAKKSIEEHNKDNITHKIYFLNYDDLDDLYTKVSNVFS